MKTFEKNLLLISALLLIVSFLFGHQTSKAQNVGLSDIKDRERFYHRLKFIRMKRPQIPENTYQIANLYNSLQMEDEAIREYRRCLKLDPNHLNAKLFLSRLLVSKGYYEEAFKLVREIIEKKQEDPNLYAWAGEILLKLNQPDAARDYFAREDEIVSSQ